MVQCSSLMDMSMDTAGSFLGLLPLDWKIPGNFKVGEDGVGGGSSAGM